MDILPGLLEAPPRDDAACPLALSAVTTALLLLLHMPPILCLDSMLIFEPVCTHKTPPLPEIDVRIIYLQQFLFV